jgi:hypothetical protein
VSSIGLGYPWEDRGLPGEDAMELFFLGFWLFFIANIVLVVWALVDAIRVRDDSMYRSSLPGQLPPPPTRVTRLGLPSTRAQGLCRRQVRRQVKGVFASYV